MKISINVRYIAVQGLYWTTFCLCLGFVSLYLLGEGASNSAIGITSALFGAASAVLQPVLGRICDLRDNVSWKKITLICLGFLSVVFALMIFISGRVFSSIMLGLAIMSINLVLPFINSALFYYENAGEKINFGVARGVGSGMYALTALIVGIMAASFGNKVIPVLGFVMAVLFFAVIISMPYNRSLDSKSAGNDTGKENRISIGQFFMKYKPFFIMLAGFILLQTTHSALCNFMLQIINSIGGDSSNLGVAMAIQAIVEVPVLFAFSLLIKKISVNQLMGIAAVGYLIKAVLFCMSGTVSAFYFAQLAQIISFAIFASASVYYTGEMMEKEDLTTGQTFMGSVIVCGNVFGSLLGGVVIDLFGVRALMIACIIISAVGTAVAHYAIKAYKKGLSEKNIAK